MGSRNWTPESGLHKMMPELVEEPHMLPELPEDSGMAPGSTAKDI